MSEANNEQSNTGADPRDHTLTQYMIADATGKIVGLGNIPAFMLEFQVPPPGGSHVLGTGDQAVHYIQDGVRTARPTNPSTLSGTTLSNVPNPSTVAINGKSYAVTDGTLEMSFPQPGTYAITVSSPFPMLPAKFSIKQ